MFGFEVSFIPPVYLDSLGAAGFQGRKGDPVPREPECGEGTDPPISLLTLTSMLRLSTPAVTLTHWGLNPCPESPDIQ